MVMTTACGGNFAVKPTAQFDPNPPQKQTPGPTPTPQPTPQPTPTPSPSPVGLQPSRGSGGKVTPGKIGRTQGGGDFYIPKSYAPQTAASSMIVMFNLNIPAFKAIADRDNVILLDTMFYEEEEEIFSILNEAMISLPKAYNIDLAKMYWAGWSNGGNIAILNGTKLENQKKFAGIMVFPGAGGKEAVDNFSQVNQQKARRTAIIYEVGSLDTAFGYVQFIPGEVNTLRKISGYSDRIAYKIWPNVGHEAWAAPGVAEHAWSWIKQFNSQSN